MNIKINDKVMIVNAEGVLERFNGKVGRVDRIYYEVTPPVAMVVFEYEPGIAFNEMVKVSVDNLAKVEPQENQEVESDIPEGAREISKDDFDAALKTVTDPKNHPAGIIESNPMASLMGSMVGVIVGKTIESDIFGDQDVITITEEELLATIWDGCNPVKMEKILNGKKPAKECAYMSLSAMMTLQNIPGVLFGESEQ